MYKKVSIESNYELSKNLYHLTTFVLSPHKLREKIIKKLQII